MKSIQTKFIALILSCVLLCAAVIGSAGIINAKQVVDTDSARMMNLQCSEQARALDGQLKRIEQSVETLSSYTAEQLESVDRLLTDEAYLAAYTHKLESVAVNAANNTEGAVAVYVRFNPDFWPPTSGLFWSKTARNGVFQQLPPTDFSSYSPDDIEHVGWYYIPVKNGKASWLSPYLNQNIDLYMISYVIPIYRNNVTVGVVGMDIDFNVMTDLVSAMQVYETGYGFLTDSDATIMYHASLPIGVELEHADAALAPVARELENGTSGSALFSYKWKGEPRAMAFRTLENGMRLALTAPKSEIDADKNSLILQICVAALCISAFAVLLTVLLTRHIIKPLRELNAAAQKIAAGDLSIPIIHQTKDEVGMLADSFQQTVCHLQKYIDYINGLAYRDSLTGIKNKTAYDDMVRGLEERMRTGRPEFAVMVLDINGLKQVNDQFGHDFGDMLIIDACKLICKIFKRSPVYRIGGDEFVVLLENADLAHYHELLAQFEAEMEANRQNTNSEFHVSIARGIAVYDAETDLVFANVFKRADDAMYQNKLAMKQGMLDAARAAPEAE